MLEAFNYVLNQKENKNLSKNIEFLEKNADLRILAEINIKFN